MYLQIKLSDLTYQDRAYIQWRAQEFVRGGGRKSERLFFAFQFFKGGPAQKIAEKIMFPTKKLQNIGEIA